MQTYSCHSRGMCRKVGTDQWRLRRSNVARGLVLLAVIVILTGMLPSSGAAQEDELGQLCWKIDNVPGQTPWTDTLRLAIARLPMATANDALMFEVFVRWRATASAVQATVGGPGPVTYQLLGAGTFALENAPTPANIELGFEAVNNIAATNTTTFGGNISCNFFASLSLATLNGTWRIQCSGATPAGTPPVTTPFTRTGNLIFQAAGCPNAQF
jgi:hypothetical protein